jgi:hypothetical protein
MNIDHGLIARIDALYKAEAVALSVLKQDGSTVDDYLKCAGEMNNALRDAWPTLRDELRRLQVDNDDAWYFVNSRMHDLSRMMKQLDSQQAAIEKAREALSEIVRNAETYEHTNSVHDQAFHLAVQEGLDTYADIAREALAALGEPANDAGWCEKCGCGNNNAGYAHLNGCRPASDAGDGWMPVTDHYPPSHEWSEFAPRFLLCYSETHDWDGSQFAIFDSADFYAFNPEDSSEPGTPDSKCVTHWRPLPASPIERG